LLRGLEIQVMSLSKAKNFNDEYRWDSDYYIKDYLNNAEYLKGKNCNDFINFTDAIKKGIFDLPPTFYKTEGIPFIRTTEIKKSTVNFNSTVFIDEAINIENDKTTLYPYDLVFTKIGAYIGDVAILPTKYKSYNFSQNVAGARLKNSIDGPYLISFFLSKYGKRQVLRSQMLSGQGKLELEDIRKYQIPIVSNDFKISLKSLLDSSFDKDLQTESNYSNATIQLLAHLGLSEWKPTEENKSIKRFSKSFAISGRLDAEYYQPKFDQLFEEIEKVEHKPLGTIASFKKSIEPGSDAYQTEGIPFIRVSDISKFGLSEPEIHLDREIYNDETLKPKKDTILLSKDGSVGIAYKVEQDLDVITSSALLHLTITDKEVLPDYLTLVLNSKLTQMQAERDAGGSIIQHWRPDEIKQVLIPILPLDIQKDLVKQIQQSFKLRQESTKLIDIAKQAVEIAIEQNENAAMKFIKDNK
jgi:restriction endonuclease S subunit